FALLAADAPKVTYKEVSAVFQQRCNSCHNLDKKKGGLALDNYTAAMQGGASGKVVEAGDPDASRLYELVSHSGEPKMPPNSPKTPAADPALIRAWLEAGAPDPSGSPVAMKQKPRAEFKPAPPAIGKPQGAPAMPQGLSTEPAVASPRANAITALAA